MATGKATSDAQKMGKKDNYKSVLVMQDAKEKVSVAGGTSAEDREQGGRGGSRKHTPPSEVIDCNTDNFGNEGKADIPRIKTTAERIEEERQLWKLDWEADMAVEKKAAADNEKKETVSEKEGVKKTVEKTGSIGEEKPVKKNAEAKTKRKVAAFKAKTAEGPAVVQEKEQKKKAAQDVGVTAGTVGGATGSAAGKVGVAKAETVSGTAGGATGMVGKATVEKVVLDTDKSAGKKEKTPDAHSKGTTEKDTRIAAVKVGAAGAGGKVGVAEGKPVSASGLAWALRLRPEIVINAFEGNGGWRDVKGNLMIAKGRLSGVARTLKLNVRVVAAAGERVLEPVLPSGCERVRVVQIPGRCATVVCMRLAYGRHGERLNVRVRDALGHHIGEEIVAWISSTGTGEARYGF